MLSSLYRNDTTQCDTIYNQYMITNKSTRLALDLNEVKNQLRMDLCDTSNDTLLRSYILAVTDFVEKYTNRILLTTTFLTFRDFFPPFISLRKSPYQSLSRFEYYKDSVLTTVDSSIYQITQSNDYVCIVPLLGMAWPTPDCRKQAVEIEFLAGYGDKQTNIPENLRVAMLNHVAALDTDRGDCGCDDSGTRGAFPSSLTSAQRCLPSNARMVYDMYKIQNITGLQACN